MNDTNSHILPFKRLGDLIYHEGPILSIFIDDDANMFLYRWVDCDDYTNKWMISSISSFELSQFYHKTLSLRQYYEKCNQCAIVEIDNALKIKKMYPLDLLPSEYLPHKNSFYKDTLYTEFSNSLKAMYINRLAVISQYKPEIYDILLLNIVEHTNEPVKELTKDFFPKSSDVTEIVQLFRALNHIVRNEILELVSKNSGIQITEICTKLKIEQSIASQHLAILRRSNLVISKKKGNLVLYFTNYIKLEEVQTAIETLTDSKKMIYQ